MRMCVHYKACVCIYIYIHTHMCVYILCPKTLICKVWGFQGFRWTYVKVAANEARRAAVLPLPERISLPVAEAAGVTHVPSLYGTSPKPVR